MDFLLPNERVGAAGDRSGACVIVSVDPPYEFRIELGETVLRGQNGFAPQRAGA